MDDQAVGGPIASIVIPAHNEAGVIGRLLRALDEGVAPGTYDVVVVCNGCSDSTADVVRGSDSDVRVIELDQPSKHAALIAGDAAASTFPRLFVDADVEISGASVSRLVDALSRPGVLAAGPTRRIPRDRAGLLVRAYYDVWERLPTVRSGLFGRGVIALSEQGNARVRQLPPMMGDDLIASESFDVSEVTIVSDAVVTIHPPRTVGDLYRRRVRAATGNAQADAAGLRRPGSSTSLRDLLKLVRAEPRLAPQVTVFAAISVVGQLGARRAVRKADFSTWTRDESSRLT